MSSISDQCRVVVAYTILYIAGVPSCTIKLNWRFKLVCSLYYWEKFTYLTHYLPVRIKVCYYLWSFFFLLFTLLYNPIEVADILKVILKVRKRQHPNPLFWSHREWDFKKQEKKVHWGFNGGMKLSQFSSKLGAKLSLPCPFSWNSFLPAVYVLKPGTIQPWECQYFIPWFNNNFMTLGTTARRGWSIKWGVQLRPNIGHEVTYK